MAYSRDTASMSVATKLHLLRDVANSGYMQAGPVPERGGGGGGGGGGWKCRWVEGCKVCGCQLKSVLIMEFSTGSYPKMTSPIGNTMSREASISQTICSYQQPVTSMRPVPVRVASTSVHSYQIWQTVHSGVKS